ncbi:MAG TPA: hypothetical protein VE079_07835 [Ensifer sp.]|nr:hypothetical protein [Ensifer sp.]
MPLPLKEFVQQVLLENNRASNIHAAVHKAWNTAVNRYPERGSWQRKSTFRALVWEEAIRELNSLGFEDSAFKLVSHRDTASFIIEDAVLFRFKHADVSLATSNYPTSEAVAFDDHDVDLYGYRGLQRVELCYVLDEFENEIIWLGISARANGTWMWKIELNSEGIVPEAELLPLEIEEMDPARLASLKQSSRDSEVEDKKKKDNQS